jgi:hypothetical protein
MGHVHRCLAVSGGRTLWHQTAVLVTRYAELQNCDTTGLESIAENCGLLEELQLRSCRFLTSDPLLRLVSSLSHLRELLLLDSSGITDEALIAIATHLPKLHQLCLFNCGRGYTKAGALALITSLTQLQRFCTETRETSVFTPALLKRWQEASPGLQLNDNYYVSTRYLARMRW